MKTLFLFDTDTDRRDAIAHMLWHYSNSHQLDFTIFGVGRRSSVTGRSPLCVFNENTWEDNEEAGHALPEKYDILLKHQGDHTEIDPRFTILYRGGAPTPSSTNFVLSVALTERNASQVLDDATLDALFHIDTAAETKKLGKLLAPTYLSEIESLYQRIDFDAPPALSFGLLSKETGNKLLLIGNHTTKDLTTYLKKVFPGTENAHWESALNKQDLQKQIGIMEENPDVYTHIFVADHLIYEGAYELNGSDTISLLRRMGVAKPIIMLSFEKHQLRIAEMQKANEARINILRTPFIFSFLLDKGQFTPESKEQWRQAQELHISSLSKDLLQDIQYYAIDWKGMLHDAIHDLRYPYEAQRWSSLSSDEQALHIKRYLSEKIKPLCLYEKRILLDPIFDDIFKAISGESQELLNVNVIRQIIRRFEPQLERLLRNGEQTEEQPMSNKAWGVLLVEDNPTDTLSITQLLQESNITVIAVADSYEAIQLLNQDTSVGITRKNAHYPKNFITVLITDWRLFKENTIHTTHIWQLLQGPDLIRYVSQHMSNRLAFHVITSKTGGIIRKVQSKLGLYAGWFAKEKVFGGTIEDQQNFISEIITSGDQIFEELCNKPIGKSWVKERGGNIPLAQVYKAMRDSPVLYYRIEKEVRMIANDWVKEITRYLAKEITNIDMPKLSDLNGGFQNTEFVSNSYERKWIDRLVARRVGIWMGLKRAADKPEKEEERIFHPLQIADTLLCGTFRKVNKERTSVVAEKEINLLLQLLSTNLCIPGTYLETLDPKNIDRSTMLVEEWIWLNEIRDTFRTGE